MSSLIFRVLSPGPVTRSLEDSVLTQKVVKRFKSPVTLLTVYKQLTYLLKTYWCTVKDHGVIFVVTTPLFEGQEEFEREGGLVLRT